MKSTLIVLASAGITFVGAPLLLSGSSLLASATDLFFQSSDQPVNRSVQQASTGSQTTEIVDIESIDKAIRESNDIEAVVSDAQFTIEGHGQVYVEGKLWGVSGILRLDETTSLDGH